MDFQSLLNSAKSTATGAFQGMSELLETATGSFGAGLGYAKDTLSMSWLFGSNEIAGLHYDAKHYFLIPYRIADCGYTLYSMRCLPEGVPPINDLPKRRIFHLPNAHAAKMVEQLLRHQAAESVRCEESGALGNSRLIELADQIDQLDQKAFNGALLIGGLVALANPVAGGIIAAKAMIPSIGLFMAKYGLKQAGETLTARNLQSKINQAEKQVLAEFHGTTATQLVDPLLAQLDKAINTDVFEYDPIVNDANWTSDDSGSSPDNTVARQLTTKAIVNTYSEILGNRKQWLAAGLGPEDIRWLQLLTTQANGAQP